MNRTLFRTLGALGCLWALAAHAQSLPPSVFTNDITLFGADQCPGSVNASTDGFCFAGTSVAHSDGGVPGSPGFDPNAAPGTHVSATAAGAGIKSTGAMTYFFQVGGPLVPGGQIAVNILSSGFASVTGGGAGSASALLTLTDSGGDGGITGPVGPGRGSAAESLRQRELRWIEVHHHRQRLEPDQRPVSHAGGYVRNQHPHKGRSTDEQHALECCHRPAHRGRSGERRPDHALLPAPQPQRVHRVGECRGFCRRHQRAGAGHARPALAGTARGRCANTAASARPARGSAAAHSGKASFLRSAA